MYTILELKLIRQTNVQVLYLPYFVLFKLVINSSLEVREVVVEYQADLVEIRIICQDQDG